MGRGPLAGKDTGEVCRSSLTIQVFLRRFLYYSATTVMYATWNEKGYGVGGVFSFFRMELRRYFYVFEVCLYYN